MDIRGKKLIVLGGLTLMCKVVVNARKRGAYVIVADYLPDSPAKKVADEAWLISTTDTEELARRCREEHIDGVITGYDDFNVTYAQRLSDAIGRPFYATGDQILNTMDKARFKALCRSTGVPSVPEYELDDTFSAEDMKKIHYPVIVKPVDRGGSIGISVCYNENDLIVAYNKAMAASRKGRVILEKYIVGDELGVTYVLQDGEIYCCAIHDRYMQEDNEYNDVRTSLAYVYPSKYAEQYMRVENQQVIDMFKSIGMKNGTLFLQGCMEDGVCYFYEMGYRLSGACQYQLLDYLCGFNPMEMIVNYSLTGKEADESIAKRVNPFFDKACCTLSVLARPGRIAKMIGLDEIANFPETIENNLWCKEGDIIAKEALGTQKQILMRCNLVAEDMVKLGEAIQKFYRTLKVLDENGKSMLMGEFDVAKLL